MKTKYPYLFVIAALLLAAGFILKQFFPINDFTNGIIKGVAIGFFAVAIWVNKRQPKSDLPGQD